MSPERIRSSILHALSVVAPEADLTSLPMAADVREELDIDSMDFLRYVTLLHQTFGIPIPEGDYPRLFSVAAGERYLAEKLPTS